MDAVAAAVAGDQRVAHKARGGGGELVRLEAVDAVLGAMEVDLQDPVEDVLAAVPPRGLGAGRDRQVDLPAGVEQVLGDLAAGLPGAHHQHGAVGELLRAAVFVAVELADVPRKCGGGRRDARELEGAFARTTFRACQRPWLVSTAKPPFAALTRVTSVPSRTGAAIRAA